MRDAKNQKIWKRMGSVVILLLVGSPEYCTITSNLVKKQQRTSQNFQTEEKGEKRGDTYFTNKTSRKNVFMYYGKFLDFGID